MDKKEHRAFVLLSILALFHTIVAYCSQFILKMFNIQCCSVFFVHSWVGFAVVLFLASSNLSTSHKCTELSSIFHGQGWWFCVFHHSSHFFRCEQEGVYYTGGWIVFFSPYNVGCICISKVLYVAVHFAGYMFQVIFKHSIGRLSSPLNRAKRMERNRKGWRAS